MKYKFLEHTADALFEAFGKSFEELLVNCTEAMCSVAYELEKVEPKESVLVKAEGKNKEELLHNFLSAVLFEMEEKEMLFSRFKILKLGGGSVEAELLGEKIDRETHSFKAEIKAVTWHEFFVREEENKWVARVLVDI